MPHKTSEIPLEQTSLFLFIGAYDSGKTYASTSWGLKSVQFGGDDPRPCYLMEMDGRLTALRGRPVEFDSYTNEDGAVGVLNRTNELRDICKKFGKAPFHTLIFSTLTSYNMFALADSLDVSYQKNLNINQEDKKVGRRRAGINLMTVEDFGFEAECFRRLIWEDLKDIKKYANVIVEAHEVEKYKRVVKVEGGPSESVFDGYKLLARDKISASVPIQFDEVYHFLPKEVVMSTKKIRRTVRFQDEVARTSFNALRTTEVFDISGKEFYPFWKEKISKNNE